MQKKKIDKSSLLLFCFLIMHMCWYWWNSWRDEAVSLGRCARFASSSAPFYSLHLKWLWREGVIWPLLLTSDHFISLWALCLPPTTLSPSSYATSWPGGEKRATKEWKTVQHTVFVPILELIIEILLVKWVEYRMQRSHRIIKGTQQGGKVLLSFLQMLPFNCTRHYFFHMFQPVHILIVMAFGEKRGFH